jgi:type I restriction enzyme M protein
VQEIFANASSFIKKHATLSTLVSEIDKLDVLFFTRGEKDKGNTKEVWVFDLRANMPQYGKRTQLVREYFVEFEAAFGDDPLVGAKALTKRGDSPDIAWIKDDSDTSADELPEPAVLAQEAMGELEAVLDELRGILEELGEDIEEVEA